MQVGLACQHGLVEIAVRSTFADAGWSVVDASEVTMGELEADLLVVEVVDAESLQLASKLSNGAQVIALMSSSQTEMVAELLRSGCAAALPVTMQPRVLLAVAELAGLGYAVARQTELMWLWSHANAMSLLSEAEIHWLKELESGLTVAAVAAEAGYSERSMYRFLSATYARLGVESRFEAIAEARRRALM